jgi:hypothetical protein
MRYRPISIGSIGWKTYLYFSIFNACFIPAIYLFCEYFDAFSLIHIFLTQLQIPKLKISHSRRSTACSRAQR